MNIVRTKTGELIHATQIKEDEVYFCPECGEEVTKKVSRNGVVFFSHIPKKHRQEETIAHQEGKHLILESLRVIVSRLNWSRMCRLLNRFQILL